MMKHCIRYEVTCSTQPVKICMLKTAEYLGSPTASCLDGYLIYNGGCYFVDSLFIIATVICGDFEFIFHTIHMKKVKCSSLYIKNFKVTRPNTYAYVMLRMV